MFPVGEHPGGYDSVHGQAESAGPGVSPPAGRRRSILKSGHLDSSPRVLRETLHELARLLETCESRVRRRALLMFGELVARWPGRCAGEPISIEIELLSDAVRMSVRNARRTLTSAEWEELVSATVIDLVDGWGTDRRAEGSAWFEFRYVRPWESGKER